MTSSQGPRPFGCLPASSPKSHRMEEAGSRTPGLGDLRISEMERPSLATLGERQGSQALPLFPCLLSWEAHYFVGNPLLWRLAC